MKIVGIVGSSADFSYNRLLLQFIGRHFGADFDFNLAEIKDLPIFNQDDDQTNSAPVQELAQVIEEADGVIIATPEHNHTINASLKSALEWLSYKIHPLDGKPVMIIGASYFTQGSSRAQLHLRQILDAPGVNALAFPGNEFLLGNVKEAFDDHGDLKDSKTISFLGTCLQKFQRFIKMTEFLNQPEAEVLPPEDLKATGTIDTTIQGVDKSAPDWVEQAAEVAHAVDGKTYVRLNRGILTVDQLNYFLASMPMELTFADSNNQFLYYNQQPDTGEKMLASRNPTQPGNPLINCHPERARKNVEWVIQQLRHGKQDVIRMHVPTHGPDKFVVHNYQALHDETGAYKGLNEYVLDIQPIIDWYLQQTGQKLVGDVDAVSGASEKSGPAKPAVDGVSGASEKAAAPAKPAVDGVSGASEKH